MQVSPNFTPRSQQAIVEAKMIATELNHDSVEDSHLLLAILKSECITVNSFLSAFSIKIDDLYSFVVTFCSLEKRAPTKQKPSYSNSFKDALSAAYEFSFNFGHWYIDIEHIFFSFLNHSDGPCSNYFYSLNLNPSRIIQAYLLVVKNKDESSVYENYETIDRPSKKEKDYGSPKESSQSDLALNSFCVNLTELASKKLINPIVGKNKEMDDICQILGRKGKNNPLLLGEPGVGKTAVIEGLALKVANGLVPPFLSNCQIYSVDLASMIAGTKYRGQFEKRLKTLVSECINDKTIILFIDEIHTLIGAGSAEGTMDAANILKPALARGEIKLIGATTRSEYKKSIEKDVALTRRFETVSIDEPTNLETLKILQGIKESYESYHNVRYSNKILKDIVNLCEVYLPSKNFPDKAIDVLDEVGSRIKIKNSSTPDEILELEKDIYHFFDSDSEPSHELMNKYDKLMSEWQAKVDEIVSIDDILEVISKKSKIPKENLVEEKDKRTLNLGRLLNRDVINQKTAITSIHKSILRSKIGLKDTNKPIGSFLFLGATGVGKTWTAKCLAKHFFGSEKNIFRFDMSEYSEKVSSSKLIGASPGYVGYEEGGALIEGLKRKPHCVILFDEIEKSHPDVQQLLLQIMEEGEIEDNMGSKAYFKDSIIILTSNIGASLTSKSSLGFSQQENSSESKIKEEAKSILSPELVNRLDDIVVFNHLEEGDLIKIFNSNIRKLSQKLKSKNIKISVSEEARSLLCKKASEEKMGARPLKRIIQSEIEDKIVDFYFKNKTDQNLEFNFIVKNDQIKCVKEN